jgi:hypothetical protein
VPHENYFCRFSFEMDMEMIFLRIIVFLRTINILFAVFLKTMQQRYLFAGCCFVLVGLVGLGWSQNIIVVRIKVLYVYTSHLDININFLL